MVDTAQETGEKKKKAFRGSGITLHAMIEYEKIIEKIITSSPLSLVLILLTFLVLIFEVFVLVTLKVFLPQYLLHHQVLLLILNQWEYFDISNLNNNAFR